jgi:hypothetical protein
MADPAIRLRPAAQAEQQLYSVNQLAEDLGITPRTIRFYEQQGLIAPRRAGTTRVLDRRDRARLIIVLRGRRLGFSLAEIREYLDLYDGDRSQVSQVQMLLARTRDRLADLDAQRRDLEATASELREIERQAQAVLDRAQARDARENAQARGAREDAQARDAGIANC